uniref:Peptidase S1 domain-containing protein n=1 Tax=Chrysemys picta bellii TaxID=8478 RepID=A0A8C3F7K0_CHRPI
MDQHLFSLRYFLPQSEQGIIGGHEAQPHSRPYMAYLAIWHGNNSSFCGGFLVAKNFVLTAAHCNGDKIIVVLGAHNITKNESSQQVIPVRCQHPHQDYDKESHNNDIMLLELESKASLNGDVGLIPLPVAHQQMPPGNVCSVAGWGRTSAYNNLSSDTLQEADVEVMPDSACPRNRRGIYHDYNPSTMMCVGKKEKGKSSFKGDSGGPLVCQQTAQGIVSWGSEMGTPPAVYTRVSTFIPWIRKTMRMLQP